MAAVVTPAPLNVGVRVFICYDRADSQSDARHIFNHLERCCQEVFYDHETIPPGAEFPSRIAERLATCNVFLAIIGDRWVWRRVHARDKDYVRTEIALARKHDIPILPVSIAKSRVVPTKLDDELKKFLDIQHMPFDSGRHYGTHLDAIEREAKRLASDHEKRRAGDSELAPPELTTDRVYRPQRRPSPHRSKSSGSSRVA